jgi:hypothetical protein
MSRSVDLFIGSSLPINELAELLHSRSGAQLIPTIDADRWRFVDGGVTAELFEHSYVDDGELWLSRYRYVLSARMADGIGPIDSAEVLGLRHLAQILHDPVNLPVLLVLDLQYRLGPAAGGAGTPDPDASEPGASAFEGASPLSGIAAPPAEPTAASGTGLAGESDPLASRRGWPT